MARRLVLVPLGCALAAATAAAPAIVRNLYEDALPHGERFAPSAHAWASDAMLGIPLALCAWFVLLAAYLRPALRARGRRFAIAYVVGGTLAQLVVGGGAMVASIVTDPDWLGPRLVECARSPDGREEACLYTGGMMCGYEVWVHDAGTTVMRLHRAISMRCAELPASATLRWRDDGPDVVDERGEVVR